MRAPQMWPGNKKPGGLDRWLNPVKSAWLNDSLVSKTPESHGWRPAVVLAIAVGEDINH